jgi:hypothetical protein
MLLSLIHWCHLILTHIYIYRNWCLNLWRSTYSLKVIFKPLNYLRKKRLLDKKKMHFQIYICFLKKNSVDKVSQKNKYAWHFQELLWFYLPYLFALLHVWINGELYKITMSLSLCVKLTTNPNTHLSWIKDFWI